MSDAGDGLDSLDGLGAEAAARAALVAALRGDAGLMARVNRVHDDPPGRAAPPFVAVGECTGADWGTKDRPGREVRLTVTVEDDRETASRLAETMPLVEAAMRRVPEAMAGWQAGSLVLVRSRLARTAAGRWVALFDYRLRVLAA